MKQRLLVMNGQRIIQAELKGQWANMKVDKARGIKPGFYNIHTAKAAEPAKQYSGQIMHVDDKHVYQQIGKGSFVKHDRDNFSKVPTIGSDLTITQQANYSAKVEDSVQTK